MAAAAETAPASERWLGLNDPKLPALMKNKPTVAMNSSGTNLSILANSLPRAGPASPGEAGSWPSAVCLSLTVPAIGTIEEFTDETGSNVGPFTGNYSTFHILSFGGGLPPNTPITITLTTYTGHSLSGAVSFVSSLQFDCTTGTILNLNGTSPDAAPPIPTLGDAALVALAGMLALLSLLAIRRRRVARL